MQKLFENFRRFVNEANDNIEAQLSKLKALDQKERNELSKYYKQIGKKFKTWQDALNQYKIDKKIPPSQKNVFTILTPQLKKVVSYIDQKKMWSKISDQAWDDLWTVAQHSDDDRAFQKHVLGKIKQFPHEEQKSHYQYLSDRISCSETGKQRYGTQDICKRTN
tara:strand:+ start:186 stop:677 length:492 start_codon:yes stop_codon:yes gene_type:complete